MMIQEMMKMTAFEFFLAVLITAFLMLFCVALIMAYSNYKSIKRLYKLFEILRDRQEHDYRLIQRYIRNGRSISNGKSK